jgi:hypothetical protein
MMAADSWHVALHLIVPSGVSIRSLSACRRACSASACSLHFALSSHVQASCLERARPMAVAAFADALAAHAAAPPGRRWPEREREAKAEGKIKGRGTSLSGKSVCMWGWRGTRQEAAACRQSAQCRIGIAEGACFALPATLGLDGGAA